MRGIRGRVVVFLAPGGPPQVVEAVSMNTSSVRVTWQPPVDRQRHGVITGYRVMYASEWARQRHNVAPGNSVPPRDATTIMMTGSDRACLITGLATWTVYRIWVTAFTSAGEGPHSDMIVVQTDEDGMSKN